MNKPTKQRAASALPFPPAVPVRFNKDRTIALDPAAPIDKALAKAALSDIPDWFRAMNLSERTFELWAESLAGVGGLVVDDVQRAVKRIAEKEKPEFWRLDIGEIRAGAIECRDRRRERIAEEEARRRPALPAPSQIALDEREARIERNKTEAAKVVAKLGRSIESPPPAPKEATASAASPTLDLSQAEFARREAKQAEYRRQLDQLEREAMADAFSSSATEEKS